MPGKFELYRHFDQSGELLYVGITNRTILRLRQHKNSCSWYDEIATITIERFPTRAEAFSAERAAIKAETPKYNRWTHEKKGPSARRPEAEAERQKLMAEADAKGIKIRRNWCVSSLRYALDQSAKGVPYPY